MPRFILIIAPDNRHPSDDSMVMSDIAPALPPGCKWAAGDISERDLLLSPADVTKRYAEPFVTFLLHQIQRDSS